MVCHLFDSGFSYLIQLLLGFVAFSTLVLKYYKESPRRKLSVWFKDVSKQIFGMMWGHLINMLLAIMLQKENDQCVAYFVNFLFDNTLGIILNVLLIYLTKRLGKKYDILAFQSGNYGQEELVQHSRKVYWTWFSQLLVWLLIIAFVKVFLFFTLIYPLRVYLLQAGSAILYGITTDENIELVIVMVIVPLIINIIQFLIQDKYLKHNEAIVEIPSSNDITKDLPPDINTETKPGSTVTSNGSARNTDSPIGQLHDVNF